MPQYVFSCTSNHLIMTIFSFCVVLAAQSTFEIRASENSTRTAYETLIKGQPSLSGYWSFENSLDPTFGNLRLCVRGKEPMYRQGPVDGDLALDISNSRFAVVSSDVALNSSSLSVEMIFRPRYITAGVLFEIASSSSTRFRLLYEHGSRRLKLWNGVKVASFESDIRIQEFNWYHVVLAISENRPTLWINGKICKSTDDIQVKPTASVPGLVLGTSDQTKGTAERGEILVSYLAIYTSSLNKDEIAARMKALGWGNKLEVEENRVPDDAEIQERINKINENYGVKVFYNYASKDEIPPVWRGMGDPSAIAAGELAKTINEIELFLATVPKSAIKSSLESIYIFGKLKAGGAAAQKSLSLLVNRPDPQTRATLYHEFSHLLGVQYPIKSDSWKLFLPNGFKYGSNPGDPFFFDNKLRADGFVIQYSKSNMSEDFAVLSDYVFVRKEETRDMIEEFPAMKRKVVALIEYYKSISSDYDFRFYNDFLSVEK